MQAFVEQAILKGLEEIAFTDHIPLPDGFDAAHRMSLSELDGYVQSIFDLKNRFPEISILLGIEADYYRGFESYLENLLNRYPFDLVIMSVHFIAGWPDGQWVFSYDFPQKTVREIYCEYLQAMKLGIQTGLFDIVGHADLIKSSGQSLLEENEVQVRQTLEAAREAGMAVEINTSGWRKAIHQPYPDLDFLPLLREYDLPITVGSDAHTPQQVGLFFERVDQALKKQHMWPVRFRKREIIFKKL